MTKMQRTFTLTSLTLLLLGVGLYGWVDRGLGVWLDTATSFIMSCF